MKEAENKAVELNCHNVWLDTSNPQAMNFYQYLGYEVFGKLSNRPEQYPATHCR